MVRRIGLHSFVVSRVPSTFSRVQMYPSVLIRSNCAFSLGLASASGSLFQASSSCSVPDATFSTSHSDPRSDALAAKSAAMPLACCSEVCRTLSIVSFPCCAFLPSESALSRTLLAPVADGCSTPPLPRPFASPLAVQRGAREETPARERDRPAAVAPYAWDRAELIAELIAAVSPPSRVACSAKASNPPTDTQPDRMAACPRGRTDRIDGRVQNVAMAFSMALACGEAAALSHPRSHAAQCSSSARRILTRPACGVVARRSGVLGTAVPLRKLPRGTHLLRSRAAVIRAKRRDDDDGGDDGESSSGGLSLPGPIDSVLNLGASLIPVSRLIRPATRLMLMPPARKGVQMLGCTQGAWRIYIERTGQRGFPGLTAGRCLLLSQQESVPRPVAKIAVGAVGAVDCRPCPSSSIMECGDTRRADVTREVWLSSSVTFRRTQVPASVFGRSRRSSPQPSSSG